VPDMPALDVTTDDLLDLDVDTLVIPIFRGGIAAAGATDTMEALGLSGVPRDDEFRGKVGQTLVLAAPGLKADRVVLAGLGRLDELTDETLRRAAGAALRAVAAKAKRVATTLAEVNPGQDAVRAVAEGALLGAHRDVRYRSKPEPTTVDSITLVVPSSMADAGAEVLPQAAAHAAAERAARELVTAPASDLGPQDLVDWASEHLDDSIDVEVFDEERLEREGFGGLIAVGRGSVRPPRMLVARYRPESPVATIALVGKGIVFDTGGLWLKPAKSMETMKCDMGGAAAVLAVMSALPSLSVNVEVVGICALAENSPSGGATRPGDIFTARNGKTVHVVNTDAEGRLVLADALSYAVEQEPDAIVDIATLTGAAITAVGKRATGIFSNDDLLLEGLLAAAGAAGEATWHLPLWDDLRENLESDIADYEHVNYDDGAGSTIAALFLQNFVDDVPWAHLDIAGPAFGEVERGHRPKQGTGAAVRTLLRWLERRG